MEVFLNLLSYFNHRFDFGIMMQIQMIEVAFTHCIDLAANFSRMKSMTNNISTFPPS
ncbi:hypothetical protein RYX36_017224, partial [Vicia faba]